MSKEEPGPNTKPNNNNNNNCDILSNTFKINIFHLDSYSSKPGPLYDKTYSVYRQKNANLATVLRVFGSTDNGLKVCLHVHQYFPHFSIRQADIASLFGHSSKDEGQIVIEDEILDIFIRDLETEIHLKMSRDNPIQTEKRTESVENEDTDHFIYQVESYSATPIYGYHKNEEIFYRFSFYSTWPMDIAKNILHAGLLNNSPILTHNCLEFLLQFYVDNQIYLNTLSFNNATFRKTDCFEKMAKHNGTFSSFEKEKFATLNMEQNLNNIPPSSTCFLECDITVDDIIFPVHEKHFPANNIHMPSSPGIIKLWNEQFSRYSKGEGDYEKFISVLKNFIERREFDILKPHLDLEILKTFILDYEYVEQNTSPVKQDFIVDQLPDEENGESCHRNFYLHDEKEESIMNSTVEELNLLNDFNSNDLSRIIYQFNDDVEETEEMRAHEDNVDEDPQLVNVPQFDGMDDTPDGGQNSTTFSHKDFVFCKLGNKKIKLNCKDFGKESIDLSKLPLRDLLRSKKVVINDQLKQKIGFLNEQSEASPLAVFKDSKRSQMKKHNAKLRSRRVVGKEKSSVNLSPMSVVKRFRQKSVNSKRQLSKDYRHSTPEIATWQGDNSTRRELKRKSLTQPSALDSCRIKLDSIFEDEILHNHTTNSQSKLLENLNFHSSQECSRTRNRSSNDISSLISAHTSTDHSFDLPMIETLTNLKWNKCLEMTLMSLELHANTRGKRLPNPNVDPIKMLTFVIYNEILNDKMAQDNASDSEQLTFAYIGVILVRPKQQRFKREEIVIGRKTVNVHYVSSELDMLLTFASYVRALDPDICLGYVSDTLSWGYLLQRAALLEIDALVLFGRITNSYQIKGTSAGAANSPPKLAGRIVFNLWNLLRHELTLRSYTFENVHYHLFKKRITKYSNEHLTSLWKRTESHYDNYSERMLLEYYLTRATGAIKILFHLNFVSRTHGLSCLFGMRFEDVLNRGSQFRVESMLLPLCRLEKYVPIRFSKELVSEQAPPEWIPLVLEPDTALHLEPVAVLDFQSLYPSVMIAHNYCFTTCLGKLKNLIRHDSALGCSQLKTGRDLLDLLKDDVHFSPNGVVFVKPHVRQGVLPKMLQDLLYTRILIKSEMKQVSKRLAEQKIEPTLKRQLKNLKRKLDICQLGLKLIANVTYGYTSANFSGRMPCIDVADSIVAKGREALENAIFYINNWGEKTGNGAKVVYGDTDSVFISFPRSNLKEAFHQANILSQAITSHNRYPMGIKLEKVYQPCFLLSKKRYCGYAFESGDQAKPVFDAKGIETIRRDNCNATSKILKRCIKILFESSGDIQQIKPYIQWQIKKIFNGRLSNLSDFIFAKQFWGLKFYAEDSMLPSCIMARQKLLSDPMAEPKMKERVSYVVIAGSPKDRLADLVRDPSDLLTDPSLQLNAEYYILRAIFPPLVRILEALPDFDIAMLIEWYAEVRHFRANKVKLDSIADVDNLKEFYQTSMCVLCHNRIQEEEQGADNEVQPQFGYPLCLECNESRHKIVSLKQRVWTASHKFNKLARICSACTKGSVQPSDFTWPINRHPCVALTCSNLFQYHQAAQDYKLLTKVDQLISEQTKLDKTNVTKLIVQTVPS